MGGEDSTAIIVRKDVCEKFEIIMSETQMDSNELLEHFFQLYNSNVQKIWNEPCVDGTPNDKQEVDKQGVRKQEVEDHDKEITNLSSPVIRRSKRKSVPSSKYRDIETHLTKSAIKKDEESQNKTQKSNQKHITLTLSKSLLKKNIDIKVSRVKSKEKEDQGSNDGDGYQSSEEEVNDESSDPTWMTDCHTCTSSDNKRRKTLRSKTKEKAICPDHEDDEKLSVYIHTSSSSETECDDGRNPNNQDVKHESDLDMTVDQDDENSNTNTDRPTDTYFVSTSSSDAKNDDTNEHTCQLCALETANVQELHSHMKDKHFSVQKNKCLYCNKTKRNCKCQSQGMHDVNKLENCSQCKKTFTSEKSLKYHMISNHGKNSTKTSCPLCGKNFSNKFGYIYHIKSIHGISEFDSNLEQTGGMALLNLTGKSGKVDPFAKDYEMIGKLFKCKYCEYKTDRSFHIKRHMSVHMGKYLQCPSCEKRFTNKYDMRTHIRVIHEKSLVLACNYCGKTFHSKDSLRNHRNKTHIGKFRYTCKICNRGFCQKSHFEGHMFKHEGIKAYECVDCQRKFSYKTLLKRHQKTCTKFPSSGKVEVAVCHICGEKFKSKAVLKEHVKGKHEELARYHCICGMEYKWRTSFNSHKKRCQMTRDISATTTTVKDCTQVRNESMDLGETNMEAKIKDQTENMEEHQQLVDAINQIISAEPVMEEIVESEVKDQGNCFVEDTNNQVSFSDFNRENLKMGDNSHCTSKFKDNKSKEILDLESNSKEENYGIDYQSYMRNFEIKPHLDLNDLNYSWRIHKFYARSNEGTVKTNGYSKCQKCHNCLFICSNDTKVDFEARGNTHQIKKEQNPLMVQADRKFKCCYCKKTFSKNFILKHHKKYCEHRDIAKRKLMDAFKCHICESIYKKEFNLRNHMIDDHGKRLVYRCNCRLIFKWRKSFRMHQKKCSLYSNLGKSETNLDKGNVNSLLREIYSLVSSQCLEQRLNNDMTLAKCKSLHSVQQCNNEQSLESYRQRTHDPVAMVRDASSNNTGALSHPETFKEIEEQTFEKDLSENLPETFPVGNDLKDVSENLPGTFSDGDDLKNGGGDDDGDGGGDDVQDNYSFKTFSNEHSYDKECSVENLSQSQGNEVYQNNQNIKQFIGHGQQQNGSITSPHSIQSQTSYSKGTVVITLSEGSEQSSTTSLHKTDGREICITEENKELVNSNERKESCIDLTFSDEEEKYSHIWPDGQFEDQNNSSAMDEDAYQSEFIVTKTEDHSSQKPFKHTLMNQVVQKTVKKKPKAKLFSCKFCNKSFLYRRVFLNHMKLHSSTENVVSRNCNTSGTIEASHQSHLVENQDCKMNVKSEVNICNICGDWFTRVASLKEHMSGKHGNPDRYRCKCGKCFKWRSSFNIHKRKCAYSNSNPSLSKPEDLQHTKDYQKFKTKKNNITRTVMSSSAESFHNLPFPTDKMQYKYNSDGSAENANMNAGFDNKWTDERSNIQVRDSSVTEYDNIRGSMSAFDDHGETEGTLGIGSSRENIDFGSDGYRNADKQSTEACDSSEALGIVQRSELVSSGNVQGLDLNIKTEQSDLEEDQTDLYIDNSNVRDIKCENDTNEYRETDNNQALEICNLIKNVSGIPECSGTQFGPYPGEIGGQNVYGYNSIFPSTDSDFTKENHLFSARGINSTHNIDHLNSEVGLRMASFQYGQTFSPYTSIKQPVLSHFNAQSQFPYQKKEKANDKTVSVSEFECKLCGDKFTLKGSLREHELGKHGNPNRYKCTCGLNFKWRSSLSLHQKKCTVAFEHKDQKIERN